MSKVSRAFFVYALLHASLVPYAYGLPPLNDAAKCSNLVSNTKGMINMVVDFNDPKEWSLWRTINDGVMGGKSQGGMNASAGYGIFSGYISLANNGGFSSVVRNIKPLASGLEQLIIDVAGDGLTYQLRAIVYINGYRVAYKHNFQTVSAQRQQMTLHLSDFEATFRGRIIPNAPLLVSENIAEIGLLITNKTEGQFNLNIFSISTCAQA